MTPNPMNCKYEHMRNQVLARVPSDIAAANKARGLDADTSVAITDVDCTPRPRWRESQAAFEARMASYGADVRALGKVVQQRNRNSSLRRVELPNGLERWFTVCACGFCGLRVDDPEVARREYDAHACAAEGVGQAAVDRAIAETDRNVLVKRTSHVLKPALVEDAVVEAAERNQVIVTDDAERRFALLEIGGK